MFRTLWRNLFVVALLVGVIVGTLIGFAEGTRVLLDQKLVGQYNDLVAWAILIDATILTAMELLLALFNGIGFGFARRSPSLSGLASLQLAETGYVLVLIQGLWINGTADPQLLAASPLTLLMMPALAGLVLAFLLLIVAHASISHFPFLSRLHPRHWLVAEAIGVLAVIAFGMLK